MSFIKKMHNRIFEYYKNEDTPLEAKNFFLVCSGSIPVLLLIGSIFLALGSNVVITEFCFFIAAFIGLEVAGALLISYKSGYAYLFCISMNFFFIPIMYFLSEGVYFGMIMFFVLGYILTILLISETKNAYFLCAIEFAFDIFLIVYSSVRSDSVYIGYTNLPHELAIALSFFLVSIIIIFIFVYQNYINSEIRRKIYKDNENIAKADNTKGRFLANITHEIRTPMNAIIGMTNLMLKDELTSSSRDNANLIKSESAKLLQIINNILEFSKLDSGRSEVINNVYSFRKMITDVINSVYQDYVKDDIKLHVFLSKDIADMVFGDEVRIKQVMKYILYGRLARTPGGTVNIDISSEFDEANCQSLFKFQITSTGAGLSKDDITAIYNAYSNYDSRQKTDYNRIGLEISICKKILNLMGGDLKIESIEGIGNSFEFSFSNYVVDQKTIASFDDSVNARVLIYLQDRNQEYSWKRIVEGLGISASYARTPQAFKRSLEMQMYSAIYVPHIFYPDLCDYITEANCEDIVYVVSELRHSIGDFGNCRIIRHPVCIFNIIESLDGSYNSDNYSKSLEVESYIYPNAKVLCVDDNNVNLLVIDNLLRDYGINATLCDSGKKALETLEKNEYDLLFIDQKMPEMDGIELKSKIKNLLNVNSTIPIICATADVGSGIRKEILALGFTDYLSKPVNTVYLDRILRNYLPDELKEFVEKPKDSNTGVDGVINNNTKEKDKEDPLLFSEKAGISNLGGDKGAYLTVLESYYKEGQQKLIEVPMQFEAGDISLYTTNVHALKSSSATVGCLGISPMFKALEFAGKENNIEFIEKNSKETFEHFEKVLEIVKDYLSSEGIIVGEEEDSAENTGDVIELDMNLVSELEDSVKSMNLRRTEELITEITANNYGSEVNQTIKKIKNAYDNFEYMEIISYIKELL